MVDIYIYYQNWIRRVLMEMEMSEGVSECERLVIELVRNLFKQENFFFFSYPGGKVTRPLIFLPPPPPPPMIGWQLVNSLLVII